MGRKQGETVGLFFVGTVNSTSSQAVGVYDPDHNLRPLQAWERLIIDSIDAQTPSTTYLLDAAASTSTVAASTLLFAFDADNAEYHAEGEGMNVRPGVTPSLLGTGSTQVDFSANARVIQTGTQPGRQNWQPSQATGYFGV